MDISYFNDSIYLNDEKLDIEDPAKTYAEYLIDSITKACEYSPRLQYEFFERLRPAAAAYYDWRIVDLGEWRKRGLEIDEIYADDDIDDDEIYDPEGLEKSLTDERLLDNLLVIRVALNAIIDDVADLVDEDGADD